MIKGYDFSGWATRTNIKCTDGRTIRKDAFADDNGRSVPLVWQHQHNDPENVLGHALLENREEGVYMYGFFNKSPKALRAKELVEHKDIGSLSIYANQLKQNGGDVLHGVIREVSLVLAGANIGAVIDNVVLAHGEDAKEDEAVIYNEEGTVYLSHGDADENEEPKEEKEEPKMSDALEHDDKKEVEEEKTSEKEDNRTVKDIFDTLSEEQKQVVYYMIGQALQQEKEDDDEEEGDDEEMKHHVFEQDDTKQNTLSHEDTQRIFTRAKQLGSLRDAVMEAVDNGVLQHDDEPAATPAGIQDHNNQYVTYGVANLDYLFPDYKLIDNPETIRTDNDWVKVLMNGARKSPFSRIKTAAFNTTMDEARAKGYVKGNRKKEEVFSLLKRTITPQTVYKKQKFDRDDIIDITDFDIVAYTKAEMREKLDEEVARAALIGDGRTVGDEDKISEDHILPIYHDDALYAIRVDVTEGTDDSATAKNFIRAAIKNRKLYKGSGSITCFTTEDWLSELLLLEDGFGHALYADKEAVARKLRVKEIVTVPQMEGLTNNDKPVVAIFVDLRDYTFGANRRGQVEFFDDFDINYNQYLYLIETRLCGMLTKPYSAMVFEVAEAEEEVVDNGET